MKKAYVLDYNNVLLEVSNRLNIVRDPRDADVIILWQDVRSSPKYLCEINKEFMGKPVVVVQHGRGATRDYLPPNNFKLIADKICVWGPAEAERMKQAGYGSDRVVITGSPLTFYTRKKWKRPQATVGFRIVVFTPVIAGNERPENLIAFYTLKKIQYDYMIEKLRAHEGDLKHLWHGWAINPECATEGTIPVDELQRDFCLFSKTTLIHDSNLYHGGIIKTNVQHISHLKDSIAALASADCVVGLEEGTFQLMAAAMGVPSVIIDGFEYGSYGGVKDYKTEIIKSPASTFCSLDNLRETIEQEIEDRSLKGHLRKKVVENEYDPFPDKDPIESIIDVASELAGGDIRKINIVSEKIEVNSNGSS